MNPDHITNPDYRYRLTRCLSTHNGLPGGDPTPANKINTVCWVMLNPSTADDLVDDPTIRRVKAFSYRAGFDNLIVVNVFAARSTRPKYLARMVDPVGPENMDVIREAMTNSARVVFAWGAAAGDACDAVIDLAASLGIEPVCLGHTKDGHPRHPLYVRAHQPLVPFGQLVFR